MRKAYVEEDAEERTDARTRILGMQRLSQMQRRPPDIILHIEVHNNAIRDTPYGRPEFYPYFKIRLDLFGEAAEDVGEEAPEFFY